MYQLVITAIIIATAVSLAVYKTFRHFANPADKCDSCAMGCAGCSLEEIKKHGGQRRPAGRKEGR